MKQKAPVGACATIYCKLDDVLSLCFLEEQQLRGKLVSATEMKRAIEQVFKLGWSFCLGKQHDMMNQVMNKPAFYAGESKSDWKSSALNTTPVLRFVLILHRTLLDPLYLHRQVGMHVFERADWFKSLKCIVQILC